ncbi:D-alanyl-D-alanine carboxypeptidase family protein [Agromyces rhizosphaerae]|uniref:D-alanyl-D-alanine carboxypeptidase family protein n=1 Tax=Agromyces rhizosphaerae TaxID=88374 RepID=UPI002491A1B4|nr:D-alanyl-D-alanine carboxypeptidase [Agromyces rhizosphaerae]
MPPSHRASPRVYRRRRIVVFGALALFVAAVTTGGVYTANALNAEVPEVAATVEVPDVAAAPAAELDAPDVGAYAIGELDDDGLLAASDADESVPIASITKVVTALVVLDAKPLGADEQGPDIAYTAADVQIYWQTIAENGSNAPVFQGSTLSERQSLEAVMLPSANNYAKSLAIWAYGSEQAYLDAARAWLDANGLHDTVVVDTSGLSPESRSTPSDLVQLGRLALRHPALASIVAQESAVLPSVGVVENTNELLGTHGVDGIKTGTTVEAGACLLFSGDYEVGSRTVTLVGVALGADTHPELNAEIAGLLDTTAAGFHEIDVIDAGDEFAGYATAWGDTAVARAAGEASVLVWSDTPITIEVDARPLALAVDGTDAGSITVRAGDEVVEVPLALDGTLEDPGTWWRLSNPGGLDPQSSASGPAE